MNIPGAIMRADSSRVSDGVYRRMVAIENRVFNGQGITSLKYSPWKRHIRESGGTEKEDNTNKKTKHSDHESNSFMDALALGSSQEKDSDDDESSSDCSSVENTEDCDGHNGLGVLLDTKPSSTVDQHTNTTAKCTATISGGSQQKKAYKYTLAESCECQTLSDHDQYLKARPSRMKCTEPFHKAVACFASSLYLEMNELDENGDELTTDETAFYCILDRFIRKVFTAANNMRQDIAESCGLLDHDDRERR